MPLEQLYALYYGKTDDQDSDTEKQQDASPMVSVHFLENK